MLDRAIETVAETTDRPVVHSDRGGHYRWPGWLSRMSDANLTRSMARKACSPDNAACEGFFGRMKTELFYPGEHIALQQGFFAWISDVDQCDDEVHLTPPCRIRLGASNVAKLPDTTHRAELRFAAPYPLARKH